MPETKMTTLDQPSDIQNIPQSEPLKTKRPYNRRKGINQKSLDNLNKGRLLANPLKSLSTILRQRLTVDNMRAICDCIIKEAKGGSIKACELVFERIDGKVSLETINTNTNISDAPIALNFEILPPANKTATQPACLPEVATGNDLDQHAQVKPEVTNPKAPVKFTLEEEPSVNFTGDKVDLEPNGPNLILSDGLELVEVLKK